MVIKCRLPVVLPFARDKAGIAGSLLHLQGVLGNGKKFPLEKFQEKIKNNSSILFWQYSPRCQPDQRFKVIFMFL
jgi:hypothetical protein